MAQMIGRGSGRRWPWWKRNGIGLPPLLYPLGLLEASRYRVCWRV